jgi:hypothetical protein
MTSLPPSECPTGAASAVASDITSSCAPAAPAPTKSMTFSAAFISAASSVTSSADGATGDGDTSVTGTDTGPAARRSATSPGIDSTETPRLPTAACNAIRSSLGSCSGSDTSSL